MNKNDTEKLVIFSVVLRLSFDACSVKALIHYYGGRFIFVARIVSRLMGMHLNSVVCTLTNH